MDTTGMVVTATYSDKTTQVVTGYTTSGYDKTITGNQTITVTYNGHTATFTVDVIDSSKPRADKPTANPAAGAVVSNTSVTLTTTTSGAEIWYTTNGNTPVKNGVGSTKYASPFTITPPVTVKAIAVKDGMNDSVVLEAAYTLSDIPGHTHDWGEWTQTTAPTCTEAGVETRICKLDATHTETRTGAAALGHDWGDWIQTTAPTCTEAGVKTRTCTHNVTHEETSTVAALGHDWEWVVTTPAYTADGIETKTCKHDPTYTDGTQTIPQIPFTDIASLGTWLSNQPENTTDTAYTVKLNVSDLGGNASTSGSLGSVLLNNSTKYVYLDLYGSSVTSIPEKTFCDSAWKGSLTLAGIIIPNSVTSIGYYAFYGCTSLANITIPDSVTSVRTPLLTSTLWYSLLL